jgi:hypothetical protein
LPGAVALAPSDGASLRGDVAGRPPRVRGVRAGESGQALLVALVTLLIAGVAAGLVGTDLALRHEAMREEATRAHLRAMIDGELATALARLDAGEPQPTSRRAWAGGEVEAERQLTGLGRYHLRVRARHFASWAAAEADVVVPAGRPPQVLAFRRLPAAAAVPR